MSEGQVHVGVEWRTGDDVTHKDDPYRRRAIELEQLAPLFALPGTMWHALNIGAAGRKDIAALPPRVPLNDLAADLPDFVDTAAAISALDLVVTVDTALAHVAGALGKPTYLLLPYHADWRWGRGGPTVRWYPTVRAFRQPVPGAWGPVVGEVQAAIRAIAGARAARDTGDV